MVEHTRLLNEENEAWTDWTARAKYYRPLILRVIDQSERRVIKGETVPAAEKVVERSRYRGGFGFEAGQSRTGGIAWFEWDQRSREYPP